MPGFQQGNRNRHEPGSAQSVFKLKRRRRRTVQIRKIRKSSQGSGKKCQAVRNSAKCTVQGFVPRPNSFDQKRICRLYRHRQVFRSFGKQNLQNARQGIVKPLPRIYDLSCMQRIQIKTRSASG